MTTIKHDKVFGGRFLAWFSALSVLGLTSTMLILLCIRHWLLILILPGALLTMVLVAFTCHRFISRRYKCGACGSVLPLPKKEKGKAFVYRFYCEHCDILWETGLKEVED
ncbi:MAG: hypothetical protein C5B50_22635 [Verrucomicrobia bacterium]|nr:MAG: hypothetical protein C5B50_22635 [Verrucomicrobiota bacterium]